MEPGAVDIDRGVEVDLARVTCRTLRLSTDQGQLEPILRSQTCLVGLERSSSRAGCVVHAEVCIVVVFKGSKHKHSGDSMLIDSNICNSPSHPHIRSRWIRIESQASSADTTHNSKRRQVGAALTHKRRHRRDGNLVPLHRQDGEIL